MNCSVALCNNRRTLKYLSHFVIKKLSHFVIKYKLSHASDSANGFVIMKKEHLSSFVAGEGTLVPCIFMCFSINFQAGSCNFFVCLFFFPDEIAFL